MQVSSCGQPKQQAKDTRGSAANMSALTQNGPDKLFPASAKSHVKSFNVFKAPPKSAIHSGRNVKYRPSKLVSYKAKTFGRELFPSSEHQYVFEGKAVGDSFTETFVQASKHTKVSNDANSSHHMSVRKQGPLQVTDQMDHDMDTSVSHSIPKKQGILKHGNQTKQSVDKVGFWSSKVQVSSKESTKSKGRNAQASELLRS